MTVMCRLCLVLVMAISLFASSHASAQSEQPPVPSQSPAPAVTPTPSVAVSPPAPVTVLASVTQPSRRHHQKSKHKHKPWMKHVHGKLVVIPVKLGEHLNNIHFGRQHWLALKMLWTYESGWEPFGQPYNDGDACAIPQAVPCTKMPYRVFRSVKGQILWGIHYIKVRYRNPTIALRIWLARNPHWY